MYSQNDYRYYLQHQLAFSDDYLAHYGVLGMHWGVRKEDRRASLANKVSANNARIAKYNEKLNTVGAKKREAKAAKYQRKLDKVERRAAKARNKLVRGKRISNKDMKRIAKAERYKAVVARKSAKNDKWKSKIESLEYRNTKLNKKIDKLDYKIDRDNFLSGIKTDVPMRTLTSNYNKSYKHTTKALRKMGAYDSTFKVNKVDNLGRVTSVTPISNKERRN